MQEGAKMQEGDIMNFAFRHGASQPAGSPAKQTVPLSATYPAHHRSGNRLLSREDAQRHVNAMLGLDDATFRKFAEPPAGVAATAITVAPSRPPSPNTLPRALSPEQRHVNAQLGLDDAAFLKYAA